MWDRMLEDFLLTKSMERISWVGGIEKKVTAEQSVIFRKLCAQKYPQHIISSLTRLSTEFCKRNDVASNMIAKNGISFGT